MPASSKLRATDIVATMVDGYAPSIQKALEGTNRRAHDIKTEELRDLLAIWEDIRTHLAQGNGV